MRASQGKLKDVAEVKVSFTALGELRSRGVKSQSKLGDMRDKEGNGGIKEIKKEIRTYK